MSEEIRVFVYGTLLSGESNNHRFLSFSNKLGDQKVEGLQMYSLGYFPACVYTGNDEHVVTGEVWEVDEETFRGLDRLEGYPSFYDRILVSTEYGEAWVYVHSQTPPTTLITSGDWREFNSQDED